MLFFHLSKFYYIGFTKILPFIFSILFLNRPMNIPIQQAKL
ncbi:hypothetical protein HMPREF1378_01252 [Enterococcus faecium R496]|uniref:Uncharacterized protein n=1 Tax=Enterococcus faecium R496 TaxID=1134836 RepID=A0AAV3GWC8_ENTFC|nr:hypothetical protein HMPREF1378_01252 [Enterococcus faecium R496]EJX82921.1 hypothetical protein HMPREF1369_00796 [Enterococcus faecium ERV99]EJY20047.1 hypothetical protein HMPREF1356_01946 [Enterococcus faecium C1904]EJY22884.1 hypothetical protein HMPREF1357_00781 [Enterococcus faecium C497]EJY44732.1 hypothetical protein HMPREF1349_01889 [Enterococcus faecium 506]